MLHGGWKLPGYAEQTMRVRRRGNQKFPHSFWFHWNLLDFEDQHGVQTTSLHMQIQRDHGFSPSSTFKMPLVKARKSTLCPTAVIFRVMVCYCLCSLTRGIQGIDAAHWANWEWHATAAELGFLLHKPTAETQQNSSCCSPSLLFPITEPPFLLPRCLSY